MAKYLEKGRMIPVFKKEDPLEKTNYRPITVLTVVRSHWFVWLKTGNIQLTTVNLSAYYQLI